MNKRIKHHLWLNLTALVVVALISVGAMSVFAYDESANSTVGSQQDNTRPYLGVNIIQGEGGAEVTKVAEDSPASEAGIEAGDIIQKIDETVVESPNQLSEYILTKAPGDVVTLTLLRDGETLTIEATLAEAPMNSANPRGDRGGRGGRPDNFDGRGFRFRNPMGYQLGVAYEVITPEIAASKGLAVEDGALITEVVEDSPAADAGLQVGDIITAVDGDKVDVEHTLSDRLYAYEVEDQVIFTVVRGEETLEISAVLAAGHPGKLFEGMGGGFGMNFGPNGEFLPFDNGQGFGPNGMMPNFPNGGGMGFGPGGMNGFSGDMETITCTNESGTIQFQISVPEGMFENFDLPDFVGGENITCERSAAQDSGAGSDGTQNSTSSLLPS